MTNNLKSFSVGEEIDLVIKNTLSQVTTSVEGLKHLVSSMRKFSTHMHPKTLLHPDVEGPVKYLLISQRYKALLGYLNKESSNHITLIDYTDMVQDLQKRFHTNSTGNRIQKVHYKVSYTHKYYEHKHFPWDKLDLLFVAIDVNKGLTYPFRVYTPLVMVKRELPLVGHIFSEAQFKIIRNVMNSSMEELEAQEDYGTFETNALMLFESLLEMPSNTPYLDERLALAYTDDQIQALTSLISTHELLGISWEDIAANEIRAILSA